MTTNGLTVACRAARSSTARSTCSRARARHRGASFQRPQAAVRGHRGDHDAPLGRADLCRGGRRRPRGHRQGRPARAGPASRSGEGGREVYELLDLGYGRCTMVLASKAGPDPALEALRRLGRDAGRHQVPAHRRSSPRGDRPPGGDRRGERLGRARAAHGDGRGDRRPRPRRARRCARTTSWFARRSFECTARLIANPVAHKLKAGADRRAARAGPRADPGLPPRCPRQRRLRCGSSDSARARSGELAAAGARRRTPALARARQGLGPSAAVSEIVERVRRVETRP